MDIKIRAGICLIFSFVSFVYFEQPLTVSVLSATTIYFFIETKQNKTEGPDSKTFKKAFITTSKIPSEISEKGISTDSQTNLESSTITVFQGIDKSHNTEAPEFRPTTEISTGTDTLQTKNKEISAICEISNNFSSTDPDQNPPKPIQIDKITITDLQKQKTNKALSLETSYFYYTPKKLKRSMVSQTFIQTFSKENETIRVEFKNKESQT